MSKDWYESHGEPGKEEFVSMPPGLKIKPATHVVDGNVWVVCTLLEGEKAGQFEVQGVYTTKEAALAACTDPLTSAARFELNRDYRGHFEFDVVTPANPEPTPTPSPSAPRGSIFPHFDVNAPMGVKPRIRVPYRREPGPAPEPSWERPISILGPGGLWGPEPK